MTEKEPDEVREVDGFGAVGCAPQCIRRDQTERAQLKKRLTFILEGRGERRKGLSNQVKESGLSLTCCVVTDPVIWHPDFGV